MSRVYLDHHAATPLTPRVTEAMQLAAADAFANPASVHAEGRRSRALLERAREQIAAAIGAKPADLLLTSGGTEACNLGLLGVLAAHPGAHALTTRIEHPAVLEPLRHLVAHGQLRLDELDVPDGCAPTASALRAAITADTRLVAVQWANHETGTLLPIAEYATQCRAAGVCLFVDATQVLGKLTVDLTTLGADLVALSAAKVGGPTGAGALWIRRGTAVEPQLFGGGQERGRRGGSPALLAQVGFGQACVDLGERIAAQPRIARLRDRFEAGILAIGAERNAARGQRLASACNVFVPGWRSDDLVAALDLEGVSVSAGAACSSGKAEPSPVVLAMHGDPARASASLRVSFGCETSEIDVDFALDACARVLTRPAW